MGLITYTPLSDGTGIDASDVNTPFQNLYNEFNGNISDTNLANASISAAKMNESGNLEQFRQDAVADFIVSGIVASSSAGLIGSVTPGYLYVGGIRKPCAGNPSITFPASKDIYIDVDSGGGLLYTGANVVTNGAAAPALASGSFRVAKMVTSAIAITSVTTAGIDSLGNVFSNKNPFGFTQVYFPTLQNSWVNYDTTWAPAYYAKDKTGTVSMSGLIKNGTTTSGTPMFTLPEGFRPALQQMFANVSNAVFSRVDVLPNGEVRTGAGTSGTYQSLSNCVFKAI